MRLTGQPKLIVLDDGDDFEAENIDGVRVLVQDFDIPEGTYPVRMQVGDLPVTIVGWVTPGNGNVPALLREIATEIEEIEKNRATT